MAPMTRARALGNIPNDLMKTYYGQRSSAGLIITEGTSPSINGLGYARIPGAFTEEQVAGWKSIAETVQQKDSKLFVQLMHTGRVSSVKNIPEGGEVVAPSAVQLSGEMYTDESGMVAHDVPKEMTIEDIEEAKNEFIESASNLISAGIDGVELHSANGYLLDQFLNPASNKRTDQYGGDYQNRARVLLEIVETLSQTVGSDKIGVRFSPYGVFNDMQGDFEDLIQLYTYLAKELKRQGISYIHIADQKVAMGAPEFATDIKKTIKENFEGVLIVGGDINSAEGAEKLIDEGYDLIYIGRPFISNPNLVEKLQNAEELVQPNFELAYTPGAEGYVDYV